MRIGARLTAPIHDAVISDVGEHITDGMLQRAGVAGYQRPALGEPIPVWPSLDSPAAGQPAEKGTDQSTWQVDGEPIKYKGHRV